MSKDDNRLLQFMPSDARWVMPSSALPEPALGQEGDTLSPEDVTCWQTHGYAVVNDIFPRQEIDAFVDDCNKVFPTRRDEEQDKGGFGGERVGMCFPFPASQRGRDLAVHPRLLRAISQLLQTPVEDIIMTQGDVWPKYAKEENEADASIRENTDQRIHCDFPNHTFVLPPPWDRPEAVELIIYLSDVEDTGGATAVVPRSGSDDPAYTYPPCNMPGFGDVPWINNRASAEEYLMTHGHEEMAGWRQENLYKRESYVRFQTGTTLLYRHDTWHRGTPLIPIKAGEKDNLPEVSFRRLVMNMTFRRAEATHIHTLHTGWTWQMYSETQWCEKMIASLSVAQRCVLGFPKPGARYWCRQTLDAVTRRYAAYGFDPAPYAALLPSSICDGDGSSASTNNHSCP
eukprot:TRINITY_DN3288_c0_g1_i1.p1 TRINITY_DN3288_c0_g1~~TRINITY_DN3288_c0_g1_i1.p1  ORF type:complete len:400 (-),score=63.48 TRINITY_DN3288_c0_g1_i1:441-1640(-)